MKYHLQNGEVMNIIWMKKYASANNIIEEIQMQKDWSPKPFVHL